MKEATTGLLSELRANRENRALARTMSGMRSEGHQHRSNRGCIRRKDGGLTLGAVKRTAWIFVMACMCLPIPGHAQSGSDGVLSGPNDPNEQLALLSATPPPLRSLNVEEPHRPVQVQRFQCNARFTLEQCEQEMLILRKVLTKYRASDLGEWRWVLVRSEDWTLLLLARGLSRVVPAITVLDARTTFFEETLVAGPSGRVSELMDRWQLGREALLDLAVRHELGHALCNDASERTAERIAKLLEQKKPVACYTKAEPKPKSD